VTAASLVALEAVFARLPKPDDRPMEFVPWIRNRAKDVAFANLSITCLPLHTSFPCRAFMEIWVTDVLHFEYKWDTLELRLKV
jgi:hypothetical protein